MRPDPEKPVRPPASLRLGVVGLDSSHAVSLTRFVNGGQGARGTSARARVVAACPGPISRDFAPSYSRAADVAATMRDELAVPFVRTPVEMFDRVDAFVITGADPRTHPYAFRQVASAGKPTAIVKILSADPDSAQEMVNRATREGIPLLAASPHRFSVARQVAVTDSDSSARIRGADVQGRMPAEPPLPATFWYGAHLIDLLFATLGAGCKAVTTTTPGDEQDWIITGVWEDGRVGVIRGMPSWPRRWKVDIHRYDGSTVSVDPTDGSGPLLAGFVEQLVEMARSGQPPVNPTQLVEVVRFAQAAECSRRTGTTIAL